MGQIKALSILDTAFFLLETAERMSNIGTIAILKPPAGSGSGSAFADSLMGRMKEQPVGEPFNMVYSGVSLKHPPRLEAAEEINLEDHCHRLSLPAPGTNRQLLDLICRIHVQRLDLSRPLWEFYIIDGLERGRGAVYAKVHHGIIDGRGFIEVCTRWFTQDPKSTEVRALWQGLRPSSKSRKPKRTLQEKAERITQQVVGLGTMGVSLARFVGKQARMTAGKGEGTPLPFLNTPDAFKAKPSIKRSFAYCVLPVADMRAVSKANGFTVNDVLLTVVDAAMNKYLHDEGGNRGKPLVIDMPVAIGGNDGGGNQIAVLQFPLGTEKATIAERVLEINKRTRGLKEQIKGEAASALIMHTAAVHGIPALTEALGLSHTPLLANVMISNPFGLEAVCYLGGAECEMALPVSVLSPPLALNVTATTYNKGLQIAFLGMAKQIPDIQRLADYTVEAFVDLCKAFDHPLKPIKN
jgi:WS/DGAT/MGAT family acyltransferase